MLLSAVSEGAATRLGHTSTDIIPPYLILQFNSFRQQQSPSLSLICSSCPLDSHEEISGAAVPSTRRVVILSPACLDVL